MRKMAAWTAALLPAAAGAALVAACGQKGPLYLPEKNAAVVTGPAAPQNAPAPQSAPAPENAPAPQTAPTPAPPAPTSPAPAAPKKQNPDDDSQK